MDSNLISEKFGGIFVKIPSSRVFQDFGIIILLEKLWNKPMGS
jgi:hypothetical protein